MGVVVLLGINVEVDDDEVVDVVVLVDNVVAYDVLLKGTGI